ncbi:hypothetical protein B0J18DRAFT_460241 [Chaetomium sp. MPI-SDFR-AT-0129]|nr:hypothetical protein B0J18DRAFT_460241 [Chaetomium sp. MPI-SDFR-AT-0129]
MANTPESGTSRVSVHDILLRGAATLAAYIREYLGPTDDFDALVDSQSNIPLREREQLAEKLIRALAENRYSRPLDLEKLDACLQRALSGGANPLPRASRPPRSRSSTLGGFEAQDHALQLERMEEADAYYQLVQDGGRPLYPIELLGDVSASFPRGPILGLDNKSYYVVTGSPGKYQELLRPWLDDIATGGYFDCWWGGTRIHYPWGVFQKQWKRWTMFRSWQRDHRDLEDDDGGFPEYLEAEKRYIKRHYSERVAAEKLAELEADPSCLKKHWEECVQKRRQRQRHCCYESGVTGNAFSDYVDAVRRRLARHSFTRPFELNQDPKQQGKLETWIEYLYFEYWWLDLFTRAIERRQQQRDEVWQKLRDTGMLQPFETAKYIKTRDYTMRHEAEEDIARAALERSHQNAKRIFTETQLDQRRLSIPKPERVRRLQQGNQEMRTAERRLEGLKKRSALIKEFKLSSDRLKDAKRDAARHRILLPWILDQIPLIEAELSRSGNAGGLDGTRTSKTIKRRRDGSDGDDSPHQMGIEKRRRLSSRPSNGTVVLDSEIQHKQVVPLIVGGTEETPPRDKQRRSRARDPPNGHSRRVRAAHEAASQGLRRSARIAARLKSAPLAEASGRVLRPRQREGPAQPSGSPSGRDNAKRQGARKRNARRGDSWGLSKFKGVLQDEL